MTDFRSGPVSQPCTCQGWRSCSISMVWTWPSGPMNTPMNDCGLSTTERWGGGGGGRGERSCSISTAWTWPSGPMNTPMNGCGLSMTERWVGGGGGGSEKLFYQYGRAWPSGPMNTPMNDCGLSTTERWVVEGGGGREERSCSISMAWAWPSGPMNTPTNNCGLSTTERWVGGAGGGLKGAREAVLLVQHGPGALGPWTLLWMTEGRSCSISMAWTWPSGPMNTPMNDCSIMVWTWPSRLCC